MADLAPSGTPQEADLADRERWEVVVQHEALAGVALERLDDLRVVGGSQGTRDHRLRLAAGEESRAVGPGQPARLAGDVADLVERPSVEPLALAEDGLPGDLFGELAEHRFGPGDRALGGVLGDRVEGPLAHPADRLLLGHLAPGVHRFGERLPPRGLETRRELLRPRGGRGLERRLDDAELGGDLVLDCDQAADLGVGKVEGVENDRLGQPVRSALDHDHRVPGAGDHQIELAALALVVGREEHELTVDPADPDPGDRGGEGNVAGHHQRGRGAGEREHVGVVLTVGGQHEADDLSVAVVPVRKQGPQRPVDQSAGQDLAFGRPALPLEEPARDAAAGVGVLSVVDGQRQEVAPFAGLRLGAGGDEDDGVAELQCGRPGRLFGELAEREGERLVAHLETS